jgi:HK97 gp10 family phage protein
MVVERDAKINAPVDTGRLRASITPEVRRGNPIEGIVGSNVDYAPYMELGTRPHWPPWGAGTPLAVWAKRHGISAYLVARAIAKKGTKARRFLQAAYEDNKQRVYAIFDRAVGGIINGR